MPDITMCTGNCPVKENCYRYMAEPNKYGQTYSSLEDICLVNGYSELIPYENKEDENVISYTLDNFIIDEMFKKKE